MCKTLVCWCSCVKSSFKHASAVTKCCMMSSIWNESPSNSKGFSYKHFQSVQLHVLVKIIVCFFCLV